MSDLTFEQKLEALMASHREMQARMEQMINEGVDARVASIQASLQQQVDNQQQGGIRRFFNRLLGG